jgi:hypothetical protein
VAVEKLIFLKNQAKFGDRKCPDDPRESFIAHPDAILFLRFSLSGVFQQPRLFATAILFDPSGDAIIARVDVK